MGEEAERVWDEHRHLVRRVARAEVGDPQAVDDVVAESALRWFRAASRDAFEIDDRARGYLLRIVRSVTIDHARRRRRDQSRTRRALPGVARSGPAERVVRREEQRIVWEALAALSPRHRSAALLVDVGGLPHTEAAQAMGMQRPAFTRLLQRARRNLRSHYLTALFGPAVGDCAAAQRALIDGTLDGAAEHIESCRRCTGCRDELAGFCIRFGAMVPMAVATKTWDPAHPPSPKPVNPTLSAIGLTLAAAVASVGLVAALTWGSTSRHRWCETA